MSVFSRPTWSTFKCAFSKRHMKYKNMDKHFAHAKCCTYLSQTVAYTPNNQMQMISTALSMYFSVCARTRVVCFRTQIPAPFGTTHESAKFTHNLWDLENDSRFVMNTYNENAFAILHSQKNLNLTDTQLIWLCIKTCSEIAGLIAVKKISPELKKKVLVAS